MRVPRTDTQFLSGVCLQCAGPGEGPLECGLRRAPSCPGLRPAGSSLFFLPFGPRPLPWRVVVLRSPVNVSNSSDKVCFESSENGKPGVWDTRCLF